MVREFITSTGKLTVWPVLPEEECKQTGGPASIQTETPKHRKNAPSKSTDTAFHSNACSIVWHFVTVKTMEGWISFRWDVALNWKSRSLTFPVQVPFFTVWPPLVSVCVQSYLIQSKGCPIFPRLSFSLQQQLTFFYFFKCQTCYISFFGFATQL